MLKKDLSIATIISWTLFCLLFLIIAFLVYYLIATNIYAVKGEKYEPKFSFYTIVSPSMEPKIKVYDVIVNKRIDNPKDIKKGDVITFQSTSNISYGMTVTHRVTDVIQGQDGLEFKTKGDNNLTEDTATAKEADLLGKVILNLPQLGRLQFFIASNGGWLIVVLMPALFIIVNDIFKLIKLNKAKKSLNDLNQELDDTEKKKNEELRKKKLKDKLLEKDNTPEETTNEKNTNEEKNNENQKEKDIVIPVIENTKKEEFTDIPKIFEDVSKSFDKKNKKAEKKENIELKPEEEKIQKNINKPTKQKNINKPTKQKDNKLTNNIFDEKVEKNIFSNEDEDSIFIPFDD